VRTVVEYNVNNKVAAKNTKLEILQQIIVSKIVMSNLDSEEIDVL
jgi:hypothetical protein